MPRKRPRTEIVTVPYRIDLLFAFISFLFPFGWSVSGFPPNIVLACACWGVSLLGALHYFWAWSKFWQHQFLRLIAAIGVPVLIVFFSLSPVENEYRLQHSPASTPTDTNVLSAVRDIGTTLEQLATNRDMPVDLRMSLLSSEQKKASNTEQLLRQQHEVLELEPLSLISLRQERSNLQAQAEIAQNRTRIQQEVEAIQNKIKSERDARMRKENQQRDEAQRKRRMSALALPFFDYAIKRLDKVLRDISEGCGEKEFSDFAGALPTIYESQMESNGMVLTGTNFLSVGRNSAWKFEISSQMETENYWINDKAYPFYTARLKLLSHSTNGDLVLTIAPQTRDPWMAVVFGLKEINFEDWDGQFYVRVAVPNGKLTGLDMVKSISPTNYTVIDEAVSRLIESEDSQFPVPK